MAPRAFTRKGKETLVAVNFLYDRLTADAAVQLETSDQEADIYESFISTPVLLTAAGKNAAQRRLRIVIRGVITIT